MKKLGMSPSEPPSAIGSGGVSVEGETALWPARGCAEVPPAASDRGALFAEPVWRPEPAVECWDCCEETCGASSVLVAAGCSGAGVVAAGCSGAAGCCGAGCWGAGCSGAGSAVVVTDGGGESSGTSAFSAGAPAGSASTHAAAEPAAIRRCVLAEPISVPEQVVEEHAVGFGAFGRRRVV